MRFPWRDRSGATREALCWPANGPLRAVLVGIHGMSGFPDQFSPLAAGLSGVAFYAMELRGQAGDPDTARHGAFLDVPGQCEDLATFLDILRARHAGAPVFLAGESMGALLVAEFAARHPAHGLAGIIPSVPVVALKRPVPRPVVSCVKILGRIAPRFRCPPSLFVNGRTVSPPLTRDTAYQDALGDRPGHIKSYALRFFSEFAELLDGIDVTACGIECPTLVLAAGKDCFVTVAQIEAWFRRIGTTDKTLRVYPEAYHLLWNDWDRDVVVRDVAEWIASRVP